ncbi:hypothetical protein NTHI1209_02047 [Haemophilus influenzae]|uniref:Uncharacterized protein n=1 Tax=Haemophilus influenzae TaxID=727 RepID=A0A158SZV4_HAEIF|nr:hypothetical protein NTHI1209_02047 [Haemophilus influenzae]
MQMIINKPIDYYYNHHYYHRHSPIFNYYNKENRCDFLNFPLQLQQP